MRNLFGALSALAIALATAAGGTVSAQAPEEFEVTSPATSPASAPKEQRMNRAGSAKFDLRQLSQTKPQKFERPEFEEPEPHPVALPGGPAKAPAPAPVPSAPAPAPTASFDGLDFATWGGGHPPDTNGDVGPTYYIQTVNTAIGVYNKSTGVRVAAFTFNTFMSQGNFGNLCDTNNFGDPVVLYDTFEDRWVITDFAFEFDGSGNVVSSPGAFQCFAVSKTGDPVSGGWNFYSIAISAGLGDYPKFGIWPDGIYMSANVFGYGSGASFQGARAWAFNKAQMYAGNSTVQIVTFDVPGGDFTVLPSNARLQTGTPPSGTPNYFVSTWQYLNALAVYKFHVDWNHLASSTFTGPDTPLSATGWPNASVANAPSLGGNALDVLQIRAMMQSQYTNIGGAESLWTTHTVRRGDTSGFAAPRWYQADVTGGTVAANLAQAATWDPDGANVMNRFVPSLAIDRAGDMALGYSTSSSTTKPAIKYAGRLASDPVNTFSQSEQVLIQGAGTQTGNCGTSSCTRWGDYSAMTLDPDGCTFWYTSEYYAVDGLNDLTRIGSFAYPSCTPLVGGTLSGKVTAIAGGAPLSGATVVLGSRTTTTDASGFYSFAGLPAGTYPTISASYPGCPTGTASSIAIVSNNTTTKNFTLASAPASGCLADTAQVDFLTGVATNLDLGTTPGDVTLPNGQFVDQQSVELGSSGVGITTTTWAGQTFTPTTSGNLTKADVNLFCSGCTGTTPNLTLSVRPTSGGVPTGSDLTTATITGFSSGSSGYYTATFAPAIAVTAGTQYALVIRPTTNPAPGTYALTRSGSSTAGYDGYSGGARVAGATSGTVWSVPLTGGISTDAAFHIYIDAGFRSPGDLVSSLKDANPDAGHTAAWTTLSWNATTPANTGVKFQAAASNSPVGPFSFVGPDGTAASYYMTSGGDLSQFNGKRYLKYRAFLSTTSSAATPTLSDATTCFSNACIAVAAPTITPDGPTTFCSGGSVSLMSSSTSGNQWSLNGSPIGGATNQNLVATASGDYTVVQTNQFSCASSASAVTHVTVNPIPGKPTITPQGPTTFLVGGSVTLSSSSASGNQWYLNGNPIGGATSKDYVATAGGNYTVKTTALGCSSTASDATTVTVLLSADLGIAVTNGVTSVIPGGTTTYTITVSNAGPNDATGATVTDLFPAGLTCTWTCAGGGTCTTSGSGNINDSVNLPASTQVVYTANCAIASTLTGTLNNQASVAAPAGVSDPASANNTANDSDPLVPHANLALTISDDRERVSVGESLNYIISVTNNAGPSAATATVTDVLPPGLTGGSWVCIEFGGASCAAGIHVGNTLSDNVTLPVGGQASYVYSATVLGGGALDQVVNTASVAMTSGSDPVPGNDSATDTDIVVLFADGFEGVPTMAPIPVGSGEDYVAATLRIDTNLLDLLGIMPNAVARGRSSDGKLLFTLEMARFGSQVNARVLTFDANGLAERSPWIAVNVDQYLLDLAWLSGTGGNNGGLSLNGGAPLVVSGSGSKALTQLFVTVAGGAPWLVLVAH